MFGILEHLPYLSYRLVYYMFTCRIKEEPSEIHFPELDEIDEVNEAEQLLNLESKVLCFQLSKSGCHCCFRI